MVVFTGISQFNAGRNVDQQYCVVYFLLSPRSSINITDVIAVIERRESVRECGLMALRTEIVEVEGK